MEDLVAQRTRTLEARNRELRLQSAELQRAYRHKSEFLAVMSHELRTPLTSIIGFADLLTDHMDDSLTDRQRDALERIERNGQDLLYLINQILDYSKIEAGRMALSPEPVAVDELLRDVLARFEPQAAAKGLTLELRTGDVPVTVETDAHRLRQILGNLMSNAVKFTACGSVTLARTSDGGDLHLSVTDTGPGISLGQLPGIFEEFRQADSSSTRQAGGTGLGLAICRRLARLLGGELRVRSRVGQGSCFSTLLPLDPSGDAPTPTPPSRLRDAAAGGDTVLIVDDDQAAARRIATYLADAGFHTTIVHSPGEAIDWAESRTPRVVVASLILPQMAGWDFVARIRSHPGMQRVPIVLIGIVDDPTIVDLCGAAGYLLKPVDLDQLGACLVQHLPELIAGQV